MDTWSETNNCAYENWPLFDTFSVIYQPPSGKQMLSEKSTMPGPLRGKMSTHLDEALQVLWMMRWDSLTKSYYSRKEVYGSVRVKGKSWRNSYMMCPTKHCWEHQAFPAIFQVPGSCCVTYRTESSGGGYVNRYDINMPPWWPWIWDWRSNTDAREGIVFSACILFKLAIDVVLIFFSARHIWSKLSYYQP